MKNKLYLLIVASTITFSGCTKLDEKLNGQISDTEPGAVNATALLQGAYISMRTPYQGNYNWSALQQITTDEAIAPTRGGDWDDNGAWRALFLHQWQADHVRIHNVFRDLNAVSYAATDLLRYNPTPQQAAEARFIRAFSQFSILDGWGQTPYREPGEEILKMPRVRNAEEQIEYLIRELNEIIPDLPTGNPQIANQDAARMLLMKVYLNKGAFLNRRNPVFDNIDMQMIVTLADQIIGRYTLANNYFDNFALNNNQSTENIFLSANTGGSNSGDIYSMFRSTMHYNMNPSGSNGFATLSNFYDKFEQDDQRRSSPYPGVTNVAGLRMGFLIGQQFNAAGIALQDRRGNPLSFTPEVSIIERGNNLEVTGIRVIKYVPDYINLGSNNAQNDWVFYRYSDVLLMKAEALLRMNQIAAALPLVNEVRTQRNASALVSLSLDNLLDELGREFFWEAHRRTDLIRFSKYLDAWQEKPASNPRALLFPIPLNQAGNTNLIQNPGYE
ncbi:RagB/SusD family nutrient uptake outer membrane protein [Sphingobacterium corticibacter]|uniref:RagB/SusD family nutrient uptake outer membrane protein n=1 Tax=Sphingobacterium corticibacter TaxID=2171749 RepID=A0A2T8HLK9_9SPHI|nr:RagB/SusD family nutrient uptake outer membrane protein [Sphingobacterium corticibacter]PVH26202.1 RagB/SusD family nutrient uptake outer membrane protein [Sphingobacterium corticibacter]